MKRYILGLMALLLSLTGNAQKISFERQTVVTRATMWKRPVTAVFKFTNKEREPLTIERVDGGCGCLSAKWPKEPLEKGDEGEISVTYDAKLLGRFDKVIEVYTNGSREPVTVRMQGKVSNEDSEAIADLYPCQIGDILLSADEIEFPEVYSGDSVTASIEIYNNGDEVYTPQLMHLPSYITAKYTPEMIARGKRGTIELTLKSDQLTDLGLNQTNIFLSRFFGDKVGDGNDIAVSAVLLPDLHEAEQQQSNPKFHLSTTEVNLGKMGKRSKLTGKVRISNRGTKALHLSKIQAFNQAVAVALNKTELQPGEEVVMRVSVVKQFLGMSKARPRVLIVTDDPKRPMEVVNVNFE